MTRLQRTLSALLAVQVVLAAVVLWPRRADNVESGPLFPELNTEEIASLTIEDDTGARTELVRKGSDNEWVVGSAGDYPADGLKVEPILTKIAAIQTGRLVARTSSSHERLQVAADEFGKRVEIEMSDGSSMVLFIGSSPNPSGTHVRRADQDETYLTGEIATWEVAPAVTNWIDSLYISLDRNEITSLILENSSGVFEFDQTSEGAWEYRDLQEGEEFEQSMLNTLVSRVSNMRMTEPLGTAEQPQYGLDDPQATVTILIEDSESQSSKQLMLLVGAQNAEDDSFIVKWSDSDYYVKVASFNADTMVTLTHDQLIKEPPTPTPGAEGSLEEEPVTVTPTPEP